MLEILQFSVSNLSESVVFSGLPMRTSVDMDEIREDIIEVKTDMELSPTCGADNPHLKRAKKLASCKPGTGHDSFLKGINVNFLAKFPAHWLIQFDRYHFADIVSSQSTMHCLEKFDVVANLKETHCDPKIIARIGEMLEELKDLRRNAENSEGFERAVDAISSGILWKSIVDSLPRGFTLTAYFTTNYLQLKSMYAQRRNHKLAEWDTFCNWIETLPMWKEWFGKETQDGTT